MKKVMALVLALALGVLLCSCGSQTDTKKDDGTYTVGICQLAQHPALDAATEGFKEALTAELGDKVKILEQNASGEANNCSTIINGFVSQKVNLILANATSPLQAAASATSTIPVLGTSDLAPLDQQAAMIKEWFPDKKTVGLLYCSAEANSQYQVDVMTAELTKLGYTCKPYSFTDSNDVASVTQKACSEVDVIYIPTDNTAANNTEAIANVVLPAKVPVIAGEAGICSGCGVATLSIDYKDLGTATGKMAAKILKGEADVRTMPVEYATKFTKLYNKDNCEKLGLTAPEGYTAQE